MAVPEQKETIEKEKIERARKGTSEIPSFTRAQVAKHNNKDDLWLIIDNKVYNVTDFASSHPGGELLMRDVAGRDVTDPFFANHSDKVTEKYLPMFHVGVVSDPVEPPEEVKRYRKLFKKFKDENWFQTDYNYYYRKLDWYALIFAATLYFVYHQQPIIAAVFLGMFFQQIAFLGHDLGHNGVTHDRQLDMRLGNLLTFFKGVSVCWWKASHNVHHLTTNSVEFDPDIQHLPVIAVTPKYFNDVYSMYHHRVFDFTNDKISQWFVSHQHIMYIPIMLLARWNLYVQSYVFFFNARKSNIRGKASDIELFCMLGFATWFFTLCLQFESFQDSLIFALLSHAIAGMLHVQITISHFGMPVISNDKKDETMDQCENFVKHQLSTSMDVSCSRWMDWFHGGLQFQAVHHLFPRLPRHRLREAKELVTKEFEDKPNGCEYVSMPFFSAVQHTLKVLKVTANQVGDFVNARG